MANVILKDVAKEFKGVIAVDGISFHISDKEFAVLVGPSGCGKTTVLRLIAGLESLTSGEIHIDNRVVNDTPPKDRDIAMVFQNYALYPHMTVYKNMGFGLKMRGFPKSEIRSRVHEAADILGIEHLLQRKPKELSGGQRQRVALGRAIVRKPKVFLFDEPLSNLDANLRVAMRAEIGKLHRTLGATIIYVTHDQVEAMTMASRIFVMDKGSLQQSGSPLEVYQRPANRFVAQFIGSPSMNFIEARLLAQNGDLLVDAGSFTLKMPPQFTGRLQSHIERDVLLGIRPEDLQYFPGGDDSPVPPLLAATVEIIEPVGSEIYVHLIAGRHTLVAKLDASVEGLAIGETIRIGIDAKKAHLFDTESSALIV
jgi:multiple sugar transport system ATP-binding protein